MCRLAAFPPGFERKEALEILWSFRMGNRDGTGEVHVKDGEFVVNKWAWPLERVEKHLFRHMPHDGWTIAHLRAATHGGKTNENTHPFIKGKTATVHNGVWSEYDIARLAIESVGGKFEGQTDSEVAAHLLEHLGPKRFYEAVRSHSGVFLTLTKSGKLWAINTGGDLEVARNKDGVCLVASDLDFKTYGALQQSRGYMLFSADGRLYRQKKERPPAREKWSFGGEAPFIPMGVTRPRFPALSPGEIDAIAEAQARAEAGESDEDDELLLDGLEDDSVLTDEDFREAAGENGHGEDENVDIIKDKDGREWRVWKRKDVETP